MLLAKKAKKRNLGTEGNINMDDVVPQFTFIDLVENVYKVLKPGKLWAVSSHEDFIVCVKWDRNFAPERQIIVDSNLGLKVSLVNLLLKSKINVPDLSRFLAF